MRKLLVSAAIAAALLGPAVLAASDARADAPPAGARRHAAAHPPAMVRHHHHRRFRAAYGHRHRGYGGGFAVGPSYGGLPPFYPGEGAAADRLEGAPVLMMLYREAYIGRGLIYNTPPHAGAGRGAALSVMY